MPLKRKGTSKQPIDQFNAVHNQSYPPISQFLEKENQFQDDSNLQPNQNQELIRQKFNLQKPQIQLQNRRQSYPLQNTSKVNQQPTIQQMHQIQSEQQNRQPLGTQLSCQPYYNNTGNQPFKNLSQYQQFQQFQQFQQYQNGQLPYMQLQQPNYPLQGYQNEQLYQNEVQQLEDQESIDLQTSIDEMSNEIIQNIKKFKQKREEHIVQQVIAKSMMNYRKSQSQGEDQSTQQDSD